MATKRKSRKLRGTGPHGVGPIKCVWTVFVKRKSEKGFRDLVTPFKTRARAQAEAKSWARDGFNTKIQQVCHSRKSSYVMQTVTLSGARKSRRKCKTCR